MKKICLFLLLFFIHKAHAQYNFVKADLLPVFVKDPRVLRLSYERTLGKNFSALLTFEDGRFGFAEIDTNKLQVMEVRGWGLLPGFRYYPFGKSQSGFSGLFIGPHLLFRHLKETYQYNSTLIHSNAIQKGYGLNIGYKYPVLDRFFVEVLAGYTAANGTWQNSDGDRNSIEPRYRYDLNNIKNYLRAEVSVGFIFPKIQRTETQKVQSKKLKEVAADLGGEEDTNYAILQVYRPKAFEGETVEYDLFLNDSLITHVKNGTYFSMEILESGTYTISATTEDKVTANIEIRKGKSYYLECSIGAGSYLGLPKFKLVPESKAESKIKRILQERK